MRITIKLSRYELGKLIKILKDEATKILLDPNYKGKSKKGFTIAKTLHQLEYIHNVDT